ncbi:MAG: Xylose isomerase domain protein barrel [Pedosphaera sp.]|nr:Xylose isomerase domain protein barrel [Pedosphaera sp.]
MSTLISRRNAIAKIAGGVALSASISPLLATEGESAKTVQKIHPLARTKPSLEELCKVAVDLGLPSVELQGPSDWPTLKKFGLTCGLASGADLGKQRGFSQVEHHEKLIASYKQIIPQLSKAGLTNLICYSGARGGLEVETALADSATGIKQLLKLAEKNKVTLYLELTNNSINSKDYDSDFGTQYSQLAQRIGSDRFKILQEVYQLQTVPHSAVTAMQKHHPYLGYYYPVGLPKKAEFAKAATIATDRMLQLNRAVKLPV